MTSDIAVILPALNEIGCVEQVVDGYLHEGTRVIVVDNGSSDGTGQAAQKAGAEVVYENKRGYGNACLAGLSYLTTRPPSIVVFADCDGTLESAEIRNMIAPLESGNVDLVLGRRVRVERGAVTNPSKSRKRCCMFHTAVVLWPYRQRYSTLPCSALVFP